MSEDKKAATETSRNDYEATHDQLTGLPNRRALIEKLTGLGERMSGRHSLLMVDLDDLKILNDSGGHAAGNFMLISAGEIMHASVRAEVNDVPEEHRGDDHPIELDAVAARIGGDEFAIVLPGVNDPVLLGEIRDRIEHALLLKGIRASIDGRPHIEGEDPETFIHEADLMMINRKENRKMNKTEKELEAVKAMGRISVESGVSLREATTILEIMRKRGMIDF
jgi:diguanylate cyclase (GGDEF)-like protein